MNRPFLALGVAALAGTAMFWSEHRRQKEELDEIRGQLRALVDSNAELRRTAPGPTLQVLPAPPPTAEPGPPPRSSPSLGETTVAPPSAAKPASREETVADAHQRYEIAYTEDRSDPDWAARAGRIVAEKMPALLPQGSEVRSFACRATICRLETSHRDVSSFNAFMQAAFANPSIPLWNAMVYSAPINDHADDRVFVTYIAREGQRLPDSPVD